MNKRKKASYGMKKKMRGGDYMEPNKELKFGGPSKPRMRATKGLSYEEWKKQNPNGTVTDYNRAVRDQYSLAERVGGKMGDDVISGNVRTPSSKKASDAATASGNRPTTQTGQSKKNDSKKSSGSSVKMDAATGRPQGTGRPAQSTSKSSAPGPGQTGTRSTPERRASAPSKGGSYAEAKKRDPKLDSYIKQRQGLKKGTPEYNAVQNKINKAYGKGPTNRPTAKPAEKPKAAPAPIKKISGKPVERGIKFGESRVAVKPENLSKAMAETGLKQAGERLQKSKTSQASPTTKKESRIMSRADKKVGKIQDRRAKAAGRKEERQDRKEGRMNKRSAIKEARGTKRAAIRKAKGKGVDMKEALKGASPGWPSDKNQPRKKALIGMGLGKIASAAGNLIGGKVGDTLSNVGNIAQNPLGAAKNAIQGNPLGQGLDQQTPPGQSGAAGVIGQVANALGGNQQQQPQQQTMKKGGKKRKKAKFGMLSVKAGIDNNPNPTRADAIAGAKGKGMKDRRARKKKK